MLCVAVFAIASYFAIDRAEAQPQDTCDQCKYLRCLKSTVAHKQAMIAVYQGLYNFWINRHVDDAGQNVEERDLSALSEPTRTKVYRATLEQLEEYAAMEKSRTDAVPAPEGCGYPHDEETGASTDSFETCKTEGLAKAQAAQPCKELADLIRQHEALHAAACRQRQNKGSYWNFTADFGGGKQKQKRLPPVIPTPAGLAAGEIAAYKLEIAGLNRIIEKLEKRCRKISFTDVTVDCVMPAGRYKVRMGQKLEGYACGDPTQAPWTITPHHFVEGVPGMPPIPQSSDKPFTTDCLAAGSDLERRRAEILRSHPQQGGGWMCVYHEGPPPKISIRFFRVSRCEGPAEQTITVDAEVSEKCEASKEPVRQAPPGPSTKPVS
jgi:hypothetical protein